MGSFQLTAVACVTLFAVFMTGASAVNFTVPLGGWCNHTANCSASLSECISNICRCSYGRVPNANNNACLPVVTNINGSCIENIQCTQLLNTACIMGRCACANGYIYYYGSCVNPSSNVATPSVYPPVYPPGPPPPTGAPVRCSSNSDCRHIRNSECRNGYCDCRRGYRPNGNHCSSGTAIRSVLAAVVLSLLFSKTVA